MEVTHRRVRELVSALPGTILALLIAVVPDFAFPLLIGSVACLVGAGFLDLLLENKELRQKIKNLEGGQPSIKWGDLKVNPVSSKTSGLNWQPFTRYITTIKVINDGSRALNDVTAWADVESRPLQLRWTSPNVEGSRGRKNLNPKDEATFEICEWDTLTRVRVLSTESGREQTPYKIGTEGQIPTQVRVTSREGATLARNAKILSIQDLRGINEAPLLSWDELPIRGVT